MQGNTMNRRHFLQHTAGSLAATTAGATFAGNLFAASGDAAKAKTAKHFLLLYCGGGAPTIDMFSQPGKTSKNRIFDTIKTTGDYELGEVMKKTAQVGKYLSVIDAYKSDHGDHNLGHLRNTRLLEGLMNLGVMVPGIGAICGYFLGNEALSLPRCVTIGDNSAGDAGFLGAAFAGFPVQQAGAIPENMGKFQLGDKTDARYARRRALFDLVEDQFTFGLTPDIGNKDRGYYQDAALAHKELYSKAFDVTMKTGAQVFQFNDKDAKYLKDHEAEGGFAKGCYLATKLFEAGVVSCEVAIGGWDMHANVEAGVRRQGAELDAGIAVAINRLVETGLYKDTVIVLTSDFGRTPNVNMNAGRDHWGRCWSTIIGGGAIATGQRYGKLNDDCNEIVEKPVATDQLFATIYTALGIDLNNRLLDLHDNLGRRYYIAGLKENAKPVADLLRAQA
jgi:uncharacterized protein (DUF1501 family)